MIRWYTVLVVGVLFCGLVKADEPLVAISGVTDKSSKDSITVQPRNSSGRFEKSIKLSVTGTSKITTLGQQVRAGKSVFVQKDTDSKDLKAKQPIAAIYLPGKTLSVLLSAVEAGEGTSLLAIHGVLDKAGKNSITVKPRNSGGKFEKSVTLHLTGTSRLTTVIRQERSGKSVYLQKETESKDLKAKQPIAVIYATGKGGSVLLTAVAESASGK